MNVPKNLKYTNDHEWVKVDGEIATIGITRPTCTKMLFDFNKDANVKFIT